jgi:hypothetical protein
MQMLKNCAALLIGTVAATCTALAAEKPQTIPPERLQSYWLLADTGSPLVPNSGRNLNAPSCAAVSYIVEKDGTTSHVKLEKLVPEGDLGKVAVNVVSAMRFTAAPQNAGKTPVFTYVVMPFNLPDASTPALATQRANALASCKLDNFAPGGNDVIHVR